MSDDERRRVLEARARAQAVKSDGMRMLLAAGYSVADTARVIGVDYGFAYGVAKRAGHVPASRRGRQETPREPRSSASAPATPPPGWSHGGVPAHRCGPSWSHPQDDGPERASPSVTRVFGAHTKDALVELLQTVPIDDLLDIVDEATFAAWYERQLDRVAACVLKLNPPELRPSVHPGYHWGHAAKVLALYVRDVVLYSRYFTDQEVEQIAPLLYCPIDGVVLDQLRAAGVRPGVSRIREIDTREKFLALQDVLQAAATVGVPRVWFDDVWGDRD